jgi:hypothetical protein
VAGLCWRGSTLPRALRWSPPPRARRLSRALSLAVVAASLASCTGPRSDLLQSSPSTITTTGPTTSTLLSTTPDTEPLVETAFELTVATTVATQLNDDPGDLVASCPAVPSALLAGETLVCRVVQPGGAQLLAAVLIDDPAGPLLEVEVDATSPTSCDHPDWALAVFASAGYPCDGQAPLPTTTIPTSGDGPGD